VHKFNTHWVLFLKTVQVTVHVQASFKVKGKQLICLSFLTLYKGFSGLFLCVHFVGLPACLPACLPMGKASKWACDF
jgi:hypothetical protein